MPPRVPGAQTSRPIPMHRRPAASPRRPWCFRSSPTPKDAHQGPAAEAPRRQAAEGHHDSPSVSATFSRTISTRSSINLMRVLSGMRDPGNARSAFPALPVPPQVRLMEPRRSAYRAPGPPAFPSPRPVHHSAPAARPRTMPASSFRARCGHRCDAVHTRVLAPLNDFASSPRPARPAAALPLRWAAACGRQPNSTRNRLPAATAFSRISS